MMFLNNNQILLQNTTRPKIDSNNRHNDNGIFLFLVFFHL